MRTMSLAILLVTNDIVLSNVYVLGDVLFKKKSHQRLGEVVIDIRCITNDFLPLVILPLVKLVFVVVTVNK